MRGGGGRRTGQLGLVEGGKAVAAAVQVE